MALNKVRNRVRFNEAGIRDVRRSEGNEELLEGVPDPTPEEAVAFEDMLQGISSALSDEVRSVLQLILEGYSVVEIAENLNVSTKTVSRRKSAIRREILKQLPDELRGVAERLAEGEEDD